MDSKINFNEPFSVRKRPPVELTPEETTRRLMLNRDWAKYKHRQHQQEVTFISRALKSQEEALQQLKAESEELYEKALEVYLSKAKNYQVEVVSNIKLHFTI